MGQTKYGKIELGPDTGLRRVREPIPEDLVCLANELVVSDTVTSQLWKDHFGNKD